MIASCSVRNHFTSALSALENLLTWMGFIVDAVKEEIEKSVGNYWTPSESIIPKRNEV